MSEPDNPRWLDGLGDELRAEVPVRPAWRARLLDELERAPKPRVGRGPHPEDPFDTAGDLHDANARSRSTRRIVVRPLTAIAAAVGFAAVGAGAMLGVMSWRTGRPVADSLGMRAGPGPVTPSVIPVAGGTADPEVVRFELSAPTATHVTLVGSFNRWNPVATPLERDPATGRWVVSLRLPAGRHVYAFVVDGDVTEDPAAPRAADADFGSANSVVLVSGRSS